MKDPIPSDSCLLESIEHVASAMVNLQNVQSHFDENKPIDFEKNRVSDNTCNHVNSFENNENCIL